MTAERRQRAERGSISLFLVVMMFAVMAGFGLVVDGGRRLQAIEEATAAAQQGARVAGQQIDVSAMNLDGSAVILDGTAAVAAGNAAIAAVGAEGSVQVIDDDTVTATATVTKDTVFLSLFGISTVSGTGEAEYDVVRGLGTEMP